MSSPLFNAIAKLQNIANAAANLSHHAEDNTVYLRKQLKAAHARINAQQRKLNIQANTIKVLATYNALLTQKAKK